MPRGGDSSTDLLLCDTRWHQKLPQFQPVKSEPQSKNFAVCGVKWEESENQKLQWLCPGNGPWEWLGTAGTQQVLKGLKLQRIGCGIKERAKATLREAGSCSESWETAAPSNGAQSQGVPEPRMVFSSCNELCDQGMPLLLQPPFETSTLSSLKTDILTNQILKFFF